MRLKLRHCGTEEDDDDFSGDEDSDGDNKRTR
jgi:hypothetical protein